MNGLADYIRTFLDKLWSYLLTGASLQYVFNFWAPTKIMAVVKTESKKKNSSFEVSIPYCSKRILGLGADGNGAFCVFDEDKGRMSSNFGDLAYIGNMDRLRISLTKVRKFLGGEIDCVACDMHPGYVSKGYAREVAGEIGCEMVEVQHHVAHVYSCAFEHGLAKDGFVGIACDGTGYGSDGKIWGGEVFLSDKRVGSLEEQMMVGGESAVLDPRKMLFGIVRRFLSDDEIMKLKMFDECEANVLSRQAGEGFNVALTTSSGRVLDAVSAFLGVCRKRSYAGKPAIELEKYALLAKPFVLSPVIVRKDRWILDTTRLFEFIYENIDRDKRRLAATAHHYLASGLLEIARKYGGDRKVVFSGGVAYNSIISGFLQNRGVLMNREVACGDYGIGFGQCAYVGLNQGGF